MMKLKASFLAILLVAAGASAAPSRCCPPSGPSDLAIDPLDCCAPMLECADTAPAALVAPAPASVTALTAVSVVVESATPALPFPESTAPRESLRAPLHRPPLYRLFSQLLI